MTRPAADLIARGLERHRQGALDEAGALYAEALALDPGDAEALNLTGVLAQQRGDFAAGADLIGRAVEIAPEPRYLANLANALNRLGQPEAAEAAGRRALACDPTSAAAQLNLGVALRALRRPDEAAEAFRAALALQPANVDAHVNLGLVLTETGDLDEAEATLRCALAIDPRAPDAWFNLANLFARRLRWSEAIAAFNAALAARPDHLDARMNLAAAHRAEGRADQAAAVYAQAADLAPHASAPRQQLGLMLGVLGRREAAVEALERAAELEPQTVGVVMDFGNALYGLAKARSDATSPGLYDRAIAVHERAAALGPDLAPTHYNLGLALLDRGRTAEAAARFEAAIALDGLYAEAHCNLGHCLAELGELARAGDACRRALELKPELAEAQSTLGNILVAQGRLEAAEAAYRMAVTLRPTLAGGYCNLGVSLFRRGLTDEALDAYDEALRLDPGGADAHWNRALLLLQRGDYAAGWPEYEWRLRRARRIRDDTLLTQPVWDGAPLQGRRILLHAEQGLGDAIQCARFIPAVAAMGGEVVLRTPAALTRLLAQVPGVAEVVADDADIPAVDCRSPLFSLPRLYAPSPEALAWPDLGDPERPGAYLAADAEAAAGWAAALDELAPGGALRVGVVWSGNRSSEAELGRSVPLTAFAPLAERPEVRLVSLQKGDGLEELTPPPTGLEVVQLGRDYDAGDLALTAAVVEALDLVVACDTSVAHLAGALGKPVWLAVNAVADWRWLQARADSPWYPSLRLYRQPVPGDWAAVFAAMARDLGRRRIRHAAARRSARPGA